MLYDKMISTERKYDMGRRFNVKPPRLRSASVEIHEHSRQARQISYEVLDVARSLRGMSGMDGVCRALRQIAEDAEREADMLRVLSDATVRISALYDRTENNISINGEKSRQKFSVHGMAVWRLSNLGAAPFGIKILR